MKPDSAILSALKLDVAATTISNHGGAGMSSASTHKLTTILSDGSTKHFFVKTGKGSAAEIMFRGEHASLNAIHDAVPALCPKSYCHGTLSDRPDQAYLVTDFLDISSRSSGRGARSGMSLAEKLAKLHSIPAPTPKGYARPQFGFPVPTCCGDTPQDNTFSSSWAEFYANRRLRFIVSQSRKSNGADKLLEHLIERTCNEIVPRLIGDNHLNDGKSVTPVVVHGDLWSGNASMGKLPSMSEPEDVVYDPSACYAHSEFELGIMKMFGGFGGKFLEEYHSLVPKTPPVAEYEDRVRLYELYHHLNHHALFGGGYRNGAISIMQELLAKYNYCGSEL